MDIKAARARIRQEWEEEVKENNEQERQIESRLRKWKFGTVLLCVAFAAACAGLAPFLAGHSHHEQWDAIGKKILILAWALFMALVLVTTMGLVEWNYLRSVKRNHVKYAPPNVKYKKS